ncbi:MAG: hypothetical protein AB1478_10295 [Nitrospirota bacterium]
MRRIEVFVVIIAFALIVSCTDIRVKDRTTDQPREEIERIKTERLRVKEIHNLFINQDIPYKAMGSGPISCHFPECSPDGTKIVFVFSGYNEPSSIWIVNSDGTGFEKISDKGDGSPSWSPDGSQIVFTRPSGEIWIMNADGTNRRFLTVGSSPKWSINNKIVFLKREKPKGRYNIWVINRDGTGLIRLTNTPEDEIQPAWFPDGKKIAFTRLSSKGIWVMNSDGTNQIQLTTKDGQMPSWSPDGKWIVFITWSDSYIWVVRSEKPADVIHLTTKARSAWDPSWSPDGKRIIFVAVYELFKGGGWKAVREGLFIMTSE